MSAVFAKLNLRAQRVIHVLNAPASFECEIARLSALQVLREVDGPVGFGLAFVVTAAGRDSAASLLTLAAEGDAVIWLAYPKVTSKNYRCEFNRDSSWDVMGAAGYEAVRQVAIDLDWSALRFRRAEHIKTLSRHPVGALSALGKQRTGAA